MPVVVVLPVKSFPLGKGRMSNRLSPEVRSRLGRALAERTARVAAEAGLQPLLVAGDGEVEKWALRSGLPALPDPGTGLNGAAAAGADWASRSASPWLVLHTDLPLLIPEEVTSLAGVLSRGYPVIAPSADGGTSALGGAGTIRFAYGPGSFGRHLGRLGEAVVISRLGLLHDVDSAEDLESARRHRRGAWLDRLLG